MIAVGRTLQPKFRAVAKMSKKTKKTVDGGKTAQTAIERCERNGMVLYACEREDCQKVSILESNVNNHGCRYCGHPSLVCWGDIAIMFTPEDGLPPRRN